MPPPPPFQRPQGPLTDDFFLNLVPSENRNNPKFMAWLGVFVSALVDAGNVASQLQTCFDLDNAVGDQLDKTGEWIGLTRYITEPLSLIYFSLDTPGAGLDQADFYAPVPFQQAPTQVVTLDDVHYRILLKARVVANNWDGTVEGAYAAWQTLFAAEGYQVLIQNVAPAVVPYFTLDDVLKGLDEAAWYDNSNSVVSDGMHIILALIGPPLDPLTAALFTGGYLDLVPAGVAVDAYATQSIPGTPMFALDVGPTPTSPEDIYTSPPVNLAGLDIGAWGVLTPPVTSLLTATIGVSSALASAAAASTSLVPSLAGASSLGVARAAGALGPLGTAHGLSAGSAVAAASFSGVGSATALGWAGAVS